VREPKVYVSRWNEIKGHLEPLFECATPEDADKAEKIINTLIDRVKDLELSLAKC